MPGQIVALTLDAEITLNNFVYYFFRKVTEWTWNVWSMAEIVRYLFSLEYSHLLTGRCFELETCRNFAGKQRHEEHPFLVLTDATVWWINTWKKVLFMYLILDSL